MAVVRDLDLGRLSWAFLVCCCCIVELQMTVGLKIQPDHLCNNDHILSTLSSCQNFGQQDITECQVHVIAMCILQFNVCIHHMFRLFRPWQDSCTAWPATLTNSRSYMKKSCSWHLTSSLRSRMKSYKEQLISRLASKKDCGQFSAK